MARRGKAKRTLAPIKEIMQILQLDAEERRRFKALSLHFLTKKKRLTEQDIVALPEKAFYDLARDLLETETTPGKGPTYTEYWPVDDDFQKTLTYAADPTKVIKHVQYIMLNQRKNMLKADTLRRRDDRTRGALHQREKHAGPSRPAGSHSPTINERVQLGPATSGETSRASPEFVSATEIIRAARQAPAALDPSDLTDPPSHLATPPITPAVPTKGPRHRTASVNSARPSIEAVPSPAAASATVTPRQTLQWVRERGDRRRERSPSAFAEYNPRLPTHRDGTLDEASVKTWRGGVQYVQERLEEFNGDLREQEWEHPMATAEDRQAALIIKYKRRGLDEFRTFLRKDLVHQQQRLRDFRVSRPTQATPEERGISRTLSP